MMTEVNAIGYSHALRVRCDGDTARGWRMADKGYIVRFTSAGSVRFPREVAENAAVAPGTNIARVRRLRC